jgi:voltage-gated potassium channel
MKKTLRYFSLAGMFFGLYVATWYWFGIQYHRIANATSGREFVFQQDIKLVSDISRFKEQQGLPSIPDKLIEEIISDKDLLRFEDTYRAPTIAIAKVRITALTGPAVEDRSTDNWQSRLGRKDALYAVRPMGARWAAFYREKLRIKKGVTHFAYAYVTDPKESPPYYAQLICYRDNRDTENMRNDFEINDVKGFTVLGVLYFSMLKWAELDASSTSKIHIYPIQIVVSLLQDSTLLPDDSPQQLKEGLLENRGYRLADFLYFSAVTITTVGYGDILPNSVRVRRLVMYEALIGVILIGVCISCVFAALSSWREKGRLERNQSG